MIRHTTATLLTLTAIISLPGGEVAWTQEVESPPSSSAGSGQNHATASTYARDDWTVETDLVETQIKTDVSRGRPTRPFKVSIRNGQACTAYIATFFNGDKYVGGSRPQFGRGYDLDEAQGESFDVYEVNPNVTDPVTGRWMRRRLPGTCRPLPGNAAVAAPPALLLRRVRDLFVLPSPQVGASPRGSGITGSPVGLWAEGMPRDTLRFPPTVLDGRQIEVEATPLSYEWDTGDGGTTALLSLYSTTAPGSPGHPAVTHVYETKSSVGRPAEGVYAIKLTVEWARRYRVVGIADPCNSWCELDPGETSTTRAYRVDEVRGLLVR